MWFALTFVLATVWATPSKVLACYPDNDFCGGPGVTDLTLIIDEAEQLATEASQWVEQNLLGDNQITDLQDLVQTTGGGFTTFDNSIQLNAEENSAVFQGTSQAIIDNDKITSQASGSAYLESQAVVSKVSVGCTIASAYQKRNASEAAADAAAIGYVLINSREGTGAYGAVPDNNSAASVAKRLCGRTGGGASGNKWSFIEGHGGLEGQVSCQ